MVADPENFKYAKLCRKNVDFKNAFVIHSKIRLLPFLGRVTAAKEKRCHPSHENVVDC